MQYFSTRNGSPAATLSEALARGLAPDGGLYVPEHLPAVDAEGPVAPLPEEAARFLAPFFEGDALAPQLESICTSAFNFDCPLHPLAEGDFVLELFHGPTAAFKDYGARFLSACGERSVSSGQRTVLVATSGDTGGAVAAAFAGRDHHRVFVLFPEGRVSPRQEAQLTSWGRNVRAFGVEGNFDDCQRIVKEAFGQERLREQWGLTSANSINVGRLLPQAAYMWVAARRHLALTGRVMHPIIPTGNLGHGLAAVWARRVGAPIGEIHLALNANRAILDVLERGHTDAHAAVPTLANAMDVAVPSNLERLRHLVPSQEALRAEVSAASVSDEEIRAALPAQADYVPCPHTACAFVLRAALPVEVPRTIVATAHPAKFETIVEPLLGRPVPVPEALRRVLSRPRSKQQVPPTLSEFEAAVNDPARGLRA